MTMDLNPNPPESTAIQPPPTSTKPKPSIISPPPFSCNGTLKRHPPPAKPTAIIYRECLRNHAATIGGHALDGCGEFMPSPLYSPSDPTSLKCAACGCHRNFHRREDDYCFNDDEDDDDDEDEFTPTKRRYPSAPHMLMALSAGLAGADAENMPATPNTATGRKRFRTKFSKEQKEKMYGFAERIGWRMQKKDEESVEEFCKEIGVAKGVLKVWMHNNKNTFTNRNPPNGTIFTTGGTIAGTNVNGENTAVDDGHHHHQENNNGGSVHAMNGSSSSS